MSKNRKKIVQAIQGLAAPVEDAIMSGYVKAVDEDKATMTVVLNTSGQILEGVMLHALSNSLQGIVIIPEQNSDVVICSVDGSGEYTLVQADKIKKVLLDIGSMQAKVGSKIEVNCDKIVFNGGENGGLVKVDKLKENLNALKDYIKNTLEPAIGDAFAAVGIGNSANGSTGKATFDSSTESEEIPFEDMDNTKITH